MTKDQRKLEGFEGFEKWFEEFEKKVRRVGRVKWFDGLINDGMIWQ